MTGDIETRYLTLEDYHPYDTDNLLTTSGVITEKYNGFFFIIFISRHRINNSLSANKKFFECRWVRNSGNITSHESVLSMYH